jgi:hypothetical protein
MRGLLTNKNLHKEYVVTSERDRIGATGWCNTTPNCSGFEHGVSCITRDSGPVALAGPKRDEAFQRCPWLRAPLRRALATS